MSSMTPVNRPGGHLHRLATRLAGTAAAAVKRLITRLVRILRAIGTVAAECNAAEQRLAQLRLSPDSYSLAPDRAPEDYAEFLYRASGPLAHERSARERAGGRPAIR
jgi:hypothetical protein